MRLLHFQQLVIAPTTHCTYSAALSGFHSFGAKYHLTTILASPIVLRYFYADLVATTKHKTIKFYITAMRFFHIDQGYPDPAQDALIQYIIKGIHRV